MRISRFVFVFLSEVAATTLLFFIIILKLCRKIAFSFKKFRLHDVEKQICMPLYQNRGVAVNVSLNLVTIKNWMQYTVHVVNYNYIALVLVQNWVSLFFYIVHATTYQSTYEHSISACHLQLSLWKYCLCSIYCLLFWAAL